MVKQVFKKAFQETLIHKVFKKHCDTKLLNNNVFIYYRMSWNFIFMIIVISTIYYLFGIELAIIILGCEIADGVGRIAKQD